MAIKYLEAEKLRLETRKKLTATPENWIQFLRTASNTYKYSYQDQLMIAAQFPNATAVAAFDVWSDRFGRKIRAGEKGIGLIDDSGNYPRMRYVFDISQSVRYRDVPQPYVWDLQEELKDDIILSLAGDLSISIEEAVSDFCENTVDSLLSDYQNAVLSEAESSDILYGLDDTAINSEFRQVVFESVKFVALTRCGLSTDTVDTDVFRNLSDFSDLAITDILGTAISNISEQVLREIEATVKTVERRNQNERNIEEQNNRRNTTPAERGGYDILSDSERGQGDRFDIYSRPRNIRVSAQSDSAGGQSDNRTMGTETQEIPERTQRMDLSANDGRTEPDSSPDSDRQGSRGNDRNADTGVDGERGRDGTAQGGQPNRVGTPPELNSEQSGRSSSEQSDIQIKTKQKRQRRKTAKAEETVSPVFSSFPVGEQMSLFAEEKSEQDRANEYAMSKIISHGTAFEDGKFRIAEYFSEQHTKAEKAKFLSDEYGWGGYAGGGESMDYRPNKGITMSYTDKDNPENNITVHLTYPQLADMIDFLIANDMYITPADIEQRQQRAIYILKTYDASNPYEAAQIERAKSILESYNIDYSQLIENVPTVETATLEEVTEMNAAIPDDTELPDINAPSAPLEPEESIYTESAVVAEFRNKTMESFHLIGDRTELDIELEVADLLRQEMIDNEIVGDIEAVVLYGSRSRGLETSEDTDIDIVVQINNAELKEDALFNLFGDMDIEIDGIPVDVNPIRPEETGTLDEYLPKAEAYLEQKQAERAAQMFSSSVGEQAQVGLEVPQAETRSNSMWDDYSRLKAENPDTILLYQVGDFFEAMGEDAQEVAKALDITLVSRAVGNDERVPMCGIPYHTLDSYTEKLSEQFSLTISSVQDGERKTYNIPSKVQLQQAESQSTKEFVPIYDGKWAIRDNRELFRSIVAENERFAQMAVEVIGNGKNPADSVKALTDEFGFERTVFLTALNIVDNPLDGRFNQADKQWACDVLKDYIEVQPDEIIHRSPEKERLFESMINGGTLYSVHNTHIAQFAESLMPAYERYLAQAEEQQAELPTDREALIEEAKQRINRFLLEEYYIKGGDFSDLSNIGIAYTTTEDEKHQIQTSVDIENTSIVKKVDGVVAETTKYETLSELVDALNDLEFSELTYISDEQIQQIEGQTASKNIPDSVSVRIGFSESAIVNRVLGLEDTDELSEPLSLAAANAMFEYLDEKQHLDRLVPSLEAGWYKKTDFEIKAVIDGEEYTYSGKFDIGDGRGQGGGSLIDHISDFVDYTLSPTNPLHLDSNELAEQQKVKDILIPFLREHQQLTPENERFINRIKYNYPMAVTEERLQSLVGKTIDYNDREYVVDRIDIQRNKAHIRDDNTGWYPLFQDVELSDIVGQNIDLLPIKQAQEQVTGTYKIYQLKDGEETRYKRFERLENQPEPVSITDYDLVYEAALSPTDTLDSLYEKFNLHHPEDFTGHSLSVSDVIVIEQDGQQQAHFVDSFGFQDVPDFFVERTQKAEQTTEQPQNADIELTFLGKRENFQRIVDAIHSGSFGSVYGSTWTEYDRLSVDVSSMPKYEDMLKLIDTAQENGVYLNAPSYNLFQSLYAKEIQAKKSQAEQTPEQPEEIKLKSIVIDLRPKAVIEAERADRQERVYQVITDNDGDIDDKQEYPTLDQAISAGKAYIADGYSGFSVFNRQTKQIEHTEGEFALYSAYSVEILKQNGYDFEAQLAKESADRYAQETAEEIQNHKITDLSLGQRPTAEKFKDNLAAIRTLKQLEAEDRNATPEEQEILSKYTGWGGMSKVFEPTNKHYPEVRELLTDDEFAAARKSTMTAFYTSPVIIKEMYAKLADMGMNGGRMLEPSCGIGNFIGMIPGSNTKVTGIELDSLTGRIAQKLYPQAQIQVCGFENSKLKENSFDVAVGNVPFGDIHVYDKQYNPHNLLIRDYFFSKSLDMVKSGGVVAFITSKGTLDKLDPTARRLLAEKAEFLGAVRLPNNAFKANAGTEVTSDIIFLKKRAEPVVIEPDKEPLWIRTTKDSNGIEMNAYFATHPEQICGTMAMVSGQFGPESTCQPNREIKLSEQLKAALSNIRGKIETQTVSHDEDVGLEVPLAAPESLRNCSYFLSDGKPYFLENGESTPVDFPKSKAKKNLAILTEMVAIRDTVRQLLEMQLDESVSDDEIKAVQAALSAMYDKFAEKYGRINDKANADVMKGDSSLPLLKSLERFDEKGEYIGKADIFSKRTIKAEHIVTEVSTSVDALAVSLASEKTKGTVDLDYMSQLTGFDKDKIISDLQGVIFKIPDMDKYVPADEYLSGNILDKLEKAQAAFNAGDTSLAVNITALQKAMPEKLEASSIDVRLGSTWIKPEYIRDFVYQLVGTPSWHRNKYSQAQFIDVQFSEVSGEWFITNKGTDKSNVQATTTYGTSDRTAYQLIEDALNLKATTVKVKTEVDGKERYVVDATKTAQARAKQELIMQKFKEWIFADKSRRDDLVETYNRQFNSSRPREFDGSHLNFVGMNPEIQLRPHQLNAVARCLYGGNTLLAHEVGAGKTFEMIAAAMEGKRLGLHSKSLICVPNHLTEQIGSDFIKLYPNANILVATKKDFEKENRRALIAKIATGNYDAIIIGHSQLEKIPISQERQQQYIREQIEETMRNIEELKAMNGERYQIKQAEKTKANLEAKLQKLLDSPKDDTVTFEELGIDKLFLDEAHLFKNLFLSTKMQNVSGVSTSSDVQKTADLFMKTKYMDEITGGKGIVFATGTPVSNTMCEIYNMQRYLQMDKLREMHLEHFDAWASTFGENVTQMELTPEGNSYRAKTRFSKFFNLPELMAIFKECADIQTADTLNLPGIPDCEVHNVAVEPSEVQKDLVDSLSKRAEAIHNRQVDPSTDNMLKITTDGRKIGLDQRLINPDLPDEPGSKVNTCVDNVFKIWTDTAEIRGTQLVFCDFSTPKKDGTFNVYDDIKSKLIAKGVPEEQIAFIHDATNEVKREEMFSKVRSGEIRVLIGSTSKMGAGTNVQDRLVASHDLDAPYRPADMEQRRGRMVRQGNKNSKVHLYRYCTKDTFDAYLFQMLERKQSFISQIMTSKSPQRRCDDIDEATLSYAEVKALCVGDPRIKEKMELDNEVGKLRLERSSHQQEQYRLEDILESIKKKIDILETTIPKNQNDFLYIQKHPTRLDSDGKKIFEGITLKGKQYTDKKEAAEAFKNAYMSAIRQGGGHKDYVPVGEYRGFQVAVLFDSFSQMYKAQLSREGTYFLDLGTDNFTRMDNVLDKLESLVANRVGRLNEHKKQLKEVTDQIGKPFPKEAEFQAKTARLAVLNAELDVDGKKNEQGGIS